MGIYANDVQKLYIAYFNRPADPIGLAYWEEQIEKNKGSAAAVANAFSASAEYKSLFEGKSSAQIVETIFQNLFGRSAEPAALTYWGVRLENGTFNVGNIATSIFVGAQGDDKKVVDNKVVVATQFTTDLDTTAEILAYSGSTAAEAARTFLKTVGATDASLTAAKAGVAAAITGIAATPVANGTTYTLTTGVDNIAGTAGNDTIIADNTGDTKQLTVADQINGGAGTDTLKVYLKSSDTGTGQPTLTGIENVWINGGSVAAYTAAAGTTGLKIEAPTMTLAADGTAVSAGNATYTLSGQAVSLKDLKSSSTTSTIVANTASANRTFTTTLSQAATDNATAIAVTVDGLASTTRTHTYNAGGTTGTHTDTQTVDVNGAKYTTLNLTASGNSNSSFVLTNTGSALRTLNVAGEKNVTVSGAGVDALTKIDASTATGRVAVDVSGAARAGAFEFKGGAGNDTLTLAAGDLGLLVSGAQLDGGAGTDTLVIKDTNLTTLYTKLNQVKGFDVLGLGTNNATVDAAQLTGIKAFSFGGQTAQTINNLGEGSSVTITGAMAGTVALGAAVGNTATEVTLGSATTAGFTVNTLTVTGLTNLTLTSNGNLTAANVLTTFNNADNSNITVKGANDLTFALATGTTTGSKVDASAFTGKLNATGSGLADIIIGGSGADTLAGGAGNDTITGGAGADKFVLSNTTATGMDWIKDFTAGVDKLFTTNNTTGTTAVLALVDKGALSTTTFADLNAAVASFAAGGANATTASQAYVFTYATDTYLIVDNGTAGYLAGTDTLVKITGVSGTLTAADIINAA